MSPSLQVVASGPETDSGDSLATAYIVFHANRYPLLDKWGLTKAHRALKFHGDGVQNLGSPFPRDFWRGSGTAGFLGYCGLQQLERLSTVSLGVGRQWRSSLGGWGGGDLPVQWVTFKWKTQAGVIITEPVEGRDCCRPSGEGIPALNGRLKQITSGALLAPDVSDLYVLE